MMCQGKEGTRQAIYVMMKVRIMISREGEALHTPFLRKFMISNDHPTPVSIFFLLRKTLSTIATLNLHFGYSHDGPISIMPNNSLLNLVNMVEKFSLTCPRKIPKLAIFTSLFLYYSKIYTFTDG